MSVQLLENVRALTSLSMEAMLLNMIKFCHGIVITKSMVLRNCLVTVSISSEKSLAREAGIL